MRPEDLFNYFKLRRFVKNSGEVLRFRKTRIPGKDLEVKMRVGPSLFLRSGMADFHLFHRIFLRDEYRVDRFPPGTWECVVDLGGNVGLFAVRSSLIARRVITCEPFPGNQAPLARNLEGRGNVTIVSAAVSGEAGTCRLYRPTQENRSAIQSAFMDMEEGAFRSEAFDDVPAVTLDQLFDRHDIEVCDLVKIDVEGMEYEILNAAGDETFSRIRRIHGEYHDVNENDPRTRIDAFSGFLRSKGFGVEVVPHRRKPNHGMFYGIRRNAR